MLFNGNKRERHFDDYEKIATAVIKDTPLPSIRAPAQLPANSSIVLWVSEEGEWSYLEDLSGGSP